MDLCTDPLVVDTFLRVHLEIAPKVAELSSPLPLRTISGAAQPLGTVSTVSRPLDEISSGSEEMLTLFDLARGLNSQMSVQDAGDVIAKHVRQLVPCSLLVFFLYDSDADELVAAHASGEHAGLVSDLRIGVGQRLSGWVAAHRQAIQNLDPVLDFGDALRSMVPRPRCCLSIPLTVRSGLVGVLSLYSTGVDSFTEDHQRIVEVVSRQVSTILNSAADLDRTKTKALGDDARSPEHRTPLPANEVLRRPRFRR